MFDYDWFHGQALAQQKDEASLRCTKLHFPRIDPAVLMDDPDAQQFHAEVITRCLIYLRDGFSYELRELADVDSKAQLTFECEPVDDHYRVGSFVVTVPFDDIVRVEVFAVHPSEKPDDLPLITGFRGRPDEQDRKHTQERPHPPEQPHESN